MTTNKNSNLSAIIIMVILVLAVIFAVININQQHQQSSPETWTAFVYKNGYESAKYEMREGFTEYSACKAFALDESAKFEHVPWQCGLRCRFDSMRQGYQCEVMENH